MNKKLNVFNEDCSAFIIVPSNTNSVIYMRNEKNEDKPCLYIEDPDEAFNFLCVSIEKEPAVICGEISNLSTVADAIEYISENHERLLKAWNEPNILISLKTLNISAIRLSKSFRKYNTDDDYEKISVVLITNTNINNVIRIDGDFKNIYLYPVSGFNGSPKQWKNIMDKLTPEERMTFLYDTVGFGPKDTYINYTTLVAKGYDVEIE